MQIKQAITMRIQALCREKGIRLNELANRSGVTPSTVYSMMDSRRKDVSAVTVKKLCDGLGLSIDQFFDDELFRNLEQEIK